MKPDGTAKSGYVSPDLGPFKCSNCVHFREPDKCNEPDVVKDPQVKGVVSADGCCNYFHHLSRNTLRGMAKRA